MDQKPKSKRGFASLSPEARTEVSKKGGHSVPPAKRSFSQNRALAATAGKKGGQAVADENRSFSKDRSLARSAGRAGGLAIPQSRCDKAVTRPANPSNP
jgi:general stress protein YciG